MKRDQFLSILAEGQGVLATPNHEFADARLESRQSVRHFFCSGGSMERRDRTQLGVGVRARLRGRWGFAAIEGDILWKEALARAMALAKAIPTGDEAPFATVPPLQVAGAAEQEMLPFDAERVWSLFTQAELAMRRSIPSHMRVRALLETGWRGVINSEGTRAVRSLARASLALTIGVQAKNGRMVPLLLASATSGSRDLVSDLQGKLENSLALADRLSSALPVQPSRCPVVLGPACAAYLIHESFGHLCEADRIPPLRREAFPLGHSVGPPDLDIWDRGDPTDASGSLPFDDEGVPCRPVALVAGGRWVGLLHSRATAAAFHAPPMGNARVTSFRFTPLCRMRVTELRPGQHEPSDLIAGIGDGLYIDAPYGGHVRSTRVHLTAVDVRRIHAGKLAEPFAGAVLVGDPLAMLRGIDAIGRDQQLIDGLGTCSRGDQRDLPVSMLAPSIRLREACVMPL